MRSPKKSIARLHALITRKHLVVAGCGSRAGSLPFAVWGCKPGRQRAATRRPSARARKAPTAETRREGRLTVPTRAVRVQRVPYRGPLRRRRGIAARFLQGTPRRTDTPRPKRPRRYTDRNGNLVQPVPTDEAGVEQTYLDADNRGCTSIATRWRTPWMSLPTYHRLIFLGTFATEQAIGTAHRLPLRFLLGATSWPTPSTRCT